MTALSFNLISTIELSFVSVCIITLLIGSPLAGTQKTLQASFYSRFQFNKSRPQITLLKNDSTEVAVCCFACSSAPGLAMALITSIVAPAAGEATATCIASGQPCTQDNKQCEMMELRLAEGLYKRLRWWGGAPG
ncbi:MAG: hypothetical protein JOZ57_04430 [Abitibacteriaceae bacterium]|nr:hypothetical protein [Abditibacteriaceae bacterium]